MRLFIRSSRYILSVIGLMQRTPLLLCFCAGFGVVYMTYRLFGRHRWLVGYVRGFLRFFFAVNGLFISLENAKEVQKLENGVFISNYFGVYDLLILWVSLPYRKLLFVPSSFFQQTPHFLRGIAHTLGIYVAESEFDIHSYKTKQFIAEPYINAKFLLVETVKVVRQHHESIPYTFMLALKHQLPVYLYQLRGSEKVRFATFLTPKTVSLKKVARIDISKRPEIAVLQYKKHMKDLLAYEKLRAYKPFLDTLQSKKTAS